MTGGHIAVLVWAMGFPIWAIVATLIGWKQARARKLAESNLRTIEDKYRPIVDQEAEVRRLRDVANAVSTDISNLRSSYSEKKAIFDRLAKEVAIFDEKLAFAEMGVYEPHFDYTDSEQYKRAILDNREVQKRMVSNKTAAIARTEWTVSGSKAKGQTMNNRNVKLALRAFNNECDAAVANVRWNNANAMEKRIVNARQQIDSLNATNDIHVTDEYAAGKMCEVVGATILFGRQYFHHEIDEPSWRECAQAGFDVLGKNENAFRAFLRGLLSEFWESNGDAGGRKVYGRLYERLAHETEDRAYDNVREIMRDEALNALPLGPGDELFGPVTERRLHSIHSAAAAFKVNRKTLHKWAIASGIVPVKATEMSPDRVLVDSETVSELARKFNSRLTWTQARSYIRAPQTFWNTLSREGYIPPAIEIKAPQAGVNAFYLRSDLDGFVEKLSRGITLPFDRARQTASFARTIKQAHCSFREIVELLLKCALRMLR